MNLFDEWWLDELKELTASLPQESIADLRVRAHGEGYVEIEFYVNLRLPHFDSQGSTDG